MAGQVMEMARWDRNGEGYADRTAGIAIQNISREEREDAMAKKRSCRRTADEDRIHDRAVKMRKMTDRQLVQYVEDQVAAARREGAAQGRAQAPRPEAVDIGAILKDIRGIRGIGDAKLDSIGTILGRYLEAM
jgi:hypothetical protein